MTSTRDRLVRIAPGPRLGCSRRRRISPASKLVLEPPHNRRGFDCCRSRVTCVFARQHSVLTGSAHNPPVAGSSPARPTSANVSRTRLVRGVVTQVVTRAAATLPAMTRPARPRVRRRGTIDALPSGALRVRVFASVDPLTKRRHDLTEIIPPGPQAASLAEKARTRLLNQVDEQRNPRTKATLSQLLDRWLGVLNVEPSTRRGYVMKIDKHIRPLLGTMQLARIDAELLETFYAELRRCRDHCGGRRYVKHRTEGPHDCGSRCKQHLCKGLADSTVRQIHWILSGAFERAVRYRWIAVNPTDLADKPPLPQPDPQPPSSAEAARIVQAAWKDPDWGAFVWCAMTLGARRGELCALRWSTADLATGVVGIRRAIGGG